MTAVAVSLVTVVSYGQSIYDGFNFSQNDYQGSARTIAMGNAFTAIGGDLGSIGINPAGSAVNSYSQITLTPSVSLSTTSNAYTPVYGTPYTNTMSASNSRAMLPNIGVNLNYSTGRNYGLKNFTIGIISNVTSDYTLSMAAGGKNIETSMTGAFASNATGYARRDLMGDIAYDRAPWQIVSAYQGGLISTYGGYTSDYIGATEALFDDQTIATAGELNQAYNAKRFGAKYDILFNAGFNFNDKWFVGANIGITSISYNYTDALVETPVNEDDFLMDFEDGRATNLLSARNRYNYTADGEGLYLKVGFIGNPVAGLRIGAAIQTPTAIDIIERYQYASDAQYANSYYNSSATSPRGEYQYRLRAPFRANAGLAYNLFGVAMISADYEFCNYSGMKFLNIDDEWGFTEDGFRETNRDIRDFAGIQHMLRVGAEVKPLPELAFRAGYNLTTSPEYYYEGSNRLNVDAPVSAFSFGMGFSSNGSFFADVACKYSKMPEAFIQPYDDYIDDVPSPEIRRTGSLVNIVATVGFRF